MNTKKNFSSMNNQINLNFLVPLLFSFEVPLSEKHIEYNCESRRMNIIKIR